MDCPEITKRLRNSRKKRLRKVCTDLMAHG
uniref:Uncharacterized protein n=1 Tax=Podoviridae sp. ctG4L18 TaxID=2825234 RepID=A0A8S5UPG5_9CAUD|nr:MAG TPA: hypothetical protein [Podoviridae sp. ctG4L18]